VAFGIKIHTLISPPLYPQPDWQPATHGYPCRALTNEQYCYEIIEMIRLELMTGNEGDVNISNEIEK